MSGVVTWLEAAGYERYEISNFARPGFRCRHNVGYWQGSWYAGLGVAAHGMLPPDEAQAACGAVRIRRANSESLMEYLNALDTQIPCRRQKSRRWTVGKPCLRR